MAVVECDDPKAVLRKLSAQRDALEKELSEAIKFLKSTPVGLSGSLVDRDGFPLDGIDLYAVRQARNTVACRTTDLRALSEEIRDKLFQLHEAARPTEVEQVESGTSASIAPVRQPFLRVAHVDAGSPAAEAQMAEGDVIMSFGEICAGEFNGSLEVIASLAKANEGQAILISVRRQNGRSEVLSIVPHAWGGRGLVGAALVPL